MATPSYSYVISQINTFIVANGNNEITANVLNPILEVITDFANNHMGDLDNLTTDQTDTLVDAINSLKQNINDIVGNSVQLHVGNANPNDTPPTSYNYGDFYMQLSPLDNDPIQLWQFNGFEWFAPDAAPSWGDIEGNIADQTDLQAELDLKADVTDLGDYQLLSEKGEANGYTPLDSGAKVPIEFLPDSIIGQVNYQGTWNASTNTPDVGDATTQKGYYYVTSVGGTYSGISYEVGDWIISNGIEWQKVDNTDAVVSVFGRIGAVVANSGDYAAFYEPIFSKNTGFNKNFGTTAGTVSEGNHTHTFASLTSKPTTIAGYGITDAVTLNTAQSISATKTFSASGNNNRIEVVNSGSGSGIYSTNSSTGVGIVVSNSSTGVGIVVSNSSTGEGIRASNTSTGVGIVSNGQTFSSGNVYEGRNNGTTTFAVTKEGNITANTFVKSGGTSSEFLKADGSTDSATYLPSSSYTASDVLDKIKTVDGSGSGLDADLLRGVHWGNVNTAIISNSDITGRDFFSSRDGVGIVEIVGISTGCVVGTDTNHDLLLRRNNTERARLTSTGVGVNGVLTGNSTASFTGTATAAPATLSTELVTKGQLDAAARPYKVYTALLSQSGTGDPTATVLENTLGGTITWARSSEGLYTATNSISGFTDNKTIVFINEGGYSSGDSTTINWVRLSGTQIRIRSVRGGAVNDGLLNIASFEIRVYT